MRADAAVGEQPGIAWLPLAIGLALLATMTVMPGLAASRSGQADHVAALLIFWAMSAGFVRGVGYIPEHRIPRWLLSAPACLAAVALAALRLAMGHGVVLPPGLI